MKNISFFVPGIPRPAGSKKSFPHSKTGKIITIDISGKKGQTWRSDIRDVARKAYQGKPFCT